MTHNNKENVMVAVFMAAGRGTRMKPLTDKIPKPMAVVQDLTLLERNIDRVIDKVDRIIIVVSYLSEIIKNKIGYSYKSKPISFVEQDNPKGGTLDAFRTAIYKDPFKSDKPINYLISNSDDLHGPDIYEQLFLNIDHDSTKAYVAAKILEDKERLSSFGIFEVDKHGHYLKIWEKPKDYVSNLVNVGIYYFPAKAALMVSPKPQTKTDGSEEYLPDLLNDFSQDQSVKVLSTLDYWYPISSLQDLEKAQQLKL